MWEGQGQQGEGKLPCAISEETDLMQAALVNSKNPYY